MADRQLATGRVRSGPRDGQIWIGVQNDPSSYERLWSALSNQPTDILVIGDEQDCLDLIRILVETLLLEDNAADLVSGLERLLADAAEGAKEVFRADA